MANNKNKKSLNTELKEIKERLNKLEKAVFNSDENIQDKTHNKEPSQNLSKDKPQKPAKENKDTNIPKTAKNVEALVNHNLEIELVKGGRVEVSEKDIVTNELVMGDDILLDFKNGSLDKIKVARRAKKEIVEGLVTQKDDNLYAVTKFGVHRLINYDVQTKGVYKGFEINVILPKEKESQAKVAVIKDIESTGNVAIEDEKNIKKAVEYDPRVLADDDLV